MSGNGYNGGLSAEELLLRLNNISKGRDRFLASNKGTRGTNTGGTELARNEMNHSLRGMSEQDIAALEAYILDAATGNGSIRVTHNNENGQELLRGQEIYDNLNEAQRAAADALYEEYTKINNPITKAHNEMMKKLCKGNKISPLLSNTEIASVAEDVVGNFTPKAGFDNLSAEKKRSVNL